MADTQRTVVLIKPDGFQRDLIGEVIQRFERKGLKIVAMKLVHLTDDMLEEHYAHHAAKPFFAGLKKFMMQTPVCAMVLEGLDAIESVRKLVGATNPRAADAGTIRADLAMNVPSNLIHASDSADASAAEVKRFFKDEDLFSYEKITDRYMFGEGI